MAHTDEHPSDYPEIEIEDPKASEVRAVNAAVDEVEAVDTAKESRAEMLKKLRAEGAKSAEQMHDYLEDEVA
ncbi:MAG: hypothetical protein V1880_01370 [Patescibacteria group bacterium]